MKREDGTVIWVEVDESPIKDDHGNVTGIAGSVHDITNRKEMEINIRKFKQIADNAAYGVSIVDVAGNIQYTNDYFANIHGYTPEELSDKTIKIFHTPEQFKEVKKITTKLLEDALHLHPIPWVLLFHRSQ